MRKLNVLVAGSTGYIGVQLVNILLNHRYVKIKYLCGNSSIGKNISVYDSKLKSKKLPNIVKFNYNFLNDVDIILLPYQMVKPKKFLKKFLKIMF
jgi:N-acetyl-gamma-glutamyl-phosphate reductase